MLHRSKENIMTRSMQSAALLAILFTFTSAAEANGPGLQKKNGGSTVSHGSNGSSHHGTTERHGPSRTYSRDHRWSSRYWNSRYGCEFCYSPVDRCYFYFYAPAGCYYPVSCIEQYQPVPFAAPAPAPVQTTGAPIAPLPAVVQVNQNTNVVR